MIIGCIEQQDRKHNYHHQMWHGLELSRTNIKIEYVHSIDEMEHHNSKDPTIVINLQLSL
jgi:hypothetical protein